MNLFYLSPKYRRDFLDEILQNVYSNYQKLLKSYENILKNRNKMLKSIFEEGEIYKKAGLQEAEIDGKKCLIKSDIYWNQKDEFGRTNKERNVKLAAIFFTSRGKLFKGGCQNWAPSGGGSAQWSTLKFLMATPIYL